MKTLLLMRHAKSSWDDSGLSDFERPLNPKGLRDAPAMGKFLAASGLLPQQIVSSTAVRAKETLSGFLEGADLKEELIVWDEDLYYGGSQAYINAIKQSSNSKKIIMTVGHNPMTEAVAATLSSKNNLRMPTAAVACIEFKSEDWGRLTPDLCRLKWIETPKTIK